MHKDKGRLMFCPECGTLGFPDAAGNISCTNYKCGYNGPVKGVKIGNKEVSLDELTSKTEAQSREYEVIGDADQQTGNLHNEHIYMCPKCDGIEVYAYLEQTRCLMSQRQEC